MFGGIYNAIFSQAIKKNYDVFLLEDLHSFNTAHNVVILCFSIFFQLLLFFLNTTMRVLIHSILN
jgi:hypothetical protein